MNQIQNNKKNDDLDDDEPLCYCNLCWSIRQIISMLPNNILFRNTIVAFIIMFVFPIFLFVIFILKPIILFILKN